MTEEGCFSASIFRLEREGLSPLFGIITPEIDQEKLAELLTGKSTTT